MKVDELVKMVKSLGDRLEGDHRAIEGFLMRHAQELMAQRNFHEWLEAEGNPALAMVIGQVGLERCCVDD